MLLLERAPAKINLTLHVLRRRDDGFHDLESLVAFTCFGDVLSLEPGAATGLTVEDPRPARAQPTLHRRRQRLCPAQHIKVPAQDPGAVLLQAARNLQTHAPECKAGAFHLFKSLPAAAGIGGGSSDAAAALRLLARAAKIETSDPRVRTAAAATGSDVPVCLERRAQMMRGRGDTLGPALAMPPLYAVLVNPGVALETKAVFAEMGLRPGEDPGFGQHPEITSALSFEALIPLLRRARNDMEDAASVLAPVIGHVLAVLAAARGCKLARMSGSGATCFGLFGTRTAASKAARVIHRDHPDWWTKACVLR